MKKSNKEIMLGLCLYYKGEKTNPFEGQDNNKAIYWDYERSFFEIPNVFQLKDLEEKFKDHMIKALDKLSEHSYNFDETIKDYFKNT